MQIADASPEHLERVAGIYAEVVRDSPATFDIEAPDLASWRRTLASCDSTAGHLMLVALDDRGAVLGYAKNGRFRDRAAYETTCETSVYVAAEARGRGVGRALYERLFELLEAGPLRVAVAALTEPNPPSTALHEAVGFTAVGTLRGVGVKFNRAWDVTWYQRSLMRPSPSDAP